MRDLLIIVPTRGRLVQALRLAKAVQETARADTELLFCIDEDDGSYPTLPAMTIPPRIARGPRRSMAAWTNDIALQHAGSYRALASMGDDHLPLTPGWDAILLAAIDCEGGTGIAYGDDRLQRHNLPTAPVISADIVKALGWMCEPTMRHYFIDNVWRDLGQESKCLFYRPDVVIEHLHPAAGKANTDATYGDAEARTGEDEIAYRRWCDTGQRDADAAIVRGLLHEAV